VEAALEINHRIDPGGRTALTVRGETDVATEPRRRAALTKQVKPWRGPGN
jgi:hypothetical protein